MRGMQSRRHAHRASGRQQQDKGHDFHGTTPHRVRSGGTPPNLAPLCVVGVCDPGCADGRRLRRPAGRGVDVPASQVRVDAVRRPAGCAGVHRFDCCRDWHRTAVAARRPLEPRQEHLPDGPDLEQRDHRVRLCGKLRATVCRAWLRRSGRGRLRIGRCRLACDALSAAYAQHRAGRFLRGGALRFGLRRRSGWRDRSELGLADRLRGGRHSGACCLRSSSC